MNFKKYLAGAAAGLVNGFFGAAGGIFAVYLLEKAGTETKRAHAMAVGIILPVSALSLALYLISGKTDLVFSLKLLPFGVLGAAVGVYLLKKIPVRALKLLFSALMLYSGIRLIVG